MTEQQITDFDHWFEQRMDPELNLTLGDKELCRHAWQAALSCAEGEAQPVAWGLKWPEDVGVNPHTVFRSEAHAQAYRAGCQSADTIMIVPLHTHPAPQVPEVTVDPDDEEQAVESMLELVGSVSGKAESVRRSVCRRLHRAGVRLPNTRSVSQVAVPEPSLKPGLEWAIAKCRALQNQGFSHTRLDVMIQDLENCLSSADATPTAPAGEQLSGNSGEFNGDVVPSSAAQQPVSDPDGLATPITVGVLERIWHHGFDSENSAEREDCHELVAARAYLEDTPAPDEREIAALVIEFCEDPNNRVRQTQMQMCALLDALRGDVLRAGKEGE